MSTVLYTLIYRILYNKLFLGEDILENPLYRTMIENHTYIKSVWEFITIWQEVYWFIEHVPGVSRSSSSKPLVFKNPSWSLGSGGHEFTS